LYDSFAPDYDRFNNWQSRLAFEIPFIEKELQNLHSDATRPLKVLDAACGTGQHAAALAKKGYRVSGADLSAPMIELAGRHAAAEGVELDLRAVGFGGLAPAFSVGAFDAVLCLGNSLPHALGPSDLQAAILDFAACLRPGGLLLIQNRNFDAVMKNQQRWIEPQPYRDEKEEYLFQRFYDFEANGLIRFNIVTLKRPLGGEWTSSTASTFLAPQLSADLHQLLKRSGFNKIETFGSMAGEPFDPAGSGNFIAAALLPENE
jgi:SAM-dependent methyltransferase